MEMPRVMVGYPVQPAEIDCACSVATLVPPLSPLGAEIDVLMRLQALALAQSLGVPRGALYTSSQNRSVARAQLERFIEGVREVAQQVYGIPTHGRKEKIEEAAPIGEIEKRCRGDFWCGLPRRSRILAHDRIRDAIEEAQEVIEEVCEKIDVPVEEIQEEARQQGDEEEG